MDSKRKKYSVPKNRQTPNSRTEIIMSLAELVAQESETTETETHGVLVPRPYADSDPESDADEIEVAGTGDSDRGKNFDESIANDLLNEVDELTEIQIDDSALEILETVSRDHSQEEFLNLVSDIISDVTDETIQPTQPPLFEEPDIPQKPTKSPAKVTKSSFHRQRPKSKPKTQYDWRKEEFFFPVDIQEDIFIPSVLEKTPYDYFKMFFDNDLINLIVDNSNLYSVQMTGKSISVTKEDISDFLAIELLVGVVQMPAYTDYWSQSLRYEKIASIMPLKRYQAIRRYLHFVDNTVQSNDRYFKIRPVLESIRKNCLSVEQEQRCSIDEMMIPYKGTRAGSRRQYIKNKPKKWGFKMFVRCGVSGIVYDFLLYGGEDTFSGFVFTEEEETHGLGGKVVHALCKSIPNQPGSVVFFGNFFCSLALVTYLRYEKGILSLGTLRANRLGHSPLSDDKSLQKKGRGAFEQIVDNDRRIVVVKWIDNKPVLLCSSFVDAYPISSTKRFQKSKKQESTQAETSSTKTSSKIDVTCPNIVKQYNAHMGGVDLADMLVALYRTGFKTHRWYLAIFSQLLDISVNNGWLLYRRDCGVNGENSSQKLKEFRLSVANALLLRNRKRGRPSSSEVQKHENKIIRKTVTPMPANEIRHDSVGHFPVFVSKGRCRNCTKGQTTIKCVKCDSRLCLVEKRNCFSNFHTK
ncbi:piggyBac transposable element-derived protein 3-like [Nilaparvata lugens]|uniref:piggyBac transposable element-derived protein 3-like n=1 Tax=Nilaparvata lugens TaxID=108931 RepID=UPI00193DE8AC|nr:piggyBac transposable element-derived protein 3-like [Nilaparvata lugens]